MVELAEPALRKTLASSNSLEVRRRVERILKKREGPGTWQQERLRALRAINVLQKIGSQEARAALVSLAEGAPDAELIEEAKASLERLAK